MPGGPGRKGCGKGPSCEGNSLAAALTLRPIIFAMRDWGMEFGTDKMACKK
jgi:hypothetical protein